MALVSDPTDEEVRRLWAEWKAEGRTFVAPSLLGYEVTNALYRAFRVRGLSQGALSATLRTALNLPIVLRSGAELHLRAAELAARFDLSAAYDAHYLALADTLGIEFWTADQRLANTVGRELPWVRLFVSRAES